MVCMILHLFSKRAQIHSSHPISSVMGVNVSPFCWMIYLFSPLRPTQPNEWFITRSSLTINWSAQKDPNRSYPASYRHANSITLSIKLADVLARCGFAKLPLTIFSTKFPTVRYSASYSTPGCFCFVDIMIHRRGNSLRAAEENGKKENFGFILLSSTLQPCHGSIVLVSGKIAIFKSFIQPVSAPFFGFLNGKTWN